MVTLATAIQTLDQLVNKLKERQDAAETLDKAYRGEFKLQFASDDFKAYFSKRYQDFSDNWCQIVADAPHERLELTGITLPGQTEADDALWQTWLENDADAYSDLAMLDAIIAKRSFGLVWGVGDHEAKVTFEHPTQCIVGYDPETRERRAGAKFWRDDDMEFATLYLPDEIWKFERPAGTTTTSGLELPAHLAMPGGWVPRSGVEKNPMPNPLGKVALVELPNRPRLIGEPMSDIQGTLHMQHAINLLWSQTFVSSDDATIGQRLLIGAEPPKIPIFDEAGNKIGDKVVDLQEWRSTSIAFLTAPPGEVTAHQWQAAKLDVFTNVIEIAVGHIAAQSRTPAHYLLIGGTIANVSGDAMKALETGLVMRTKEKQKAFGRGFRDMFELIALAEGDSAKAADVRRAKMSWDSIESITESQRADAFQKRIESGYPFEYAMELDGISPTERARVMEMKRNELMDPTLMALANEATRAGDVSASGA